MQIYYYVHTGHRIGLDRFHRSVTIIRTLQEKFEDLEILLLCSDFRIAQEAKSLGIKRAVGIDVVRNIPQIAPNGSKIIFDSDEINPVMHKDMLQYFSKFIRLCDDIECEKQEREAVISPYIEGEGILKAYAIDKKYFGSFEKHYEISLFFGDDDYEEDLLKNIECFKDLNANLLLGYYFFMDYEEKLAPYFNQRFEFEAYDDVVTKSNIFIASSPQAILEALASGSKVVYMHRDDYTDGFIALFESLNIPIIYNFDREKLYTVINSLLSHKYHELINYEEKIVNFLKKELNL